MLDIVIVTWRSDRLLLAAVASIASVARRTRELIASLTIVDNGPRSIDAEALAIAAGAVPCRIIANALNVGFAQACNQGAALGQARYLLFINPDVEIATEALAASIACLEDDVAGRIGAVGVCHVDGNGMRQRSSARFPTPWRILGHALLLDRILPWLVAPHFESAAAHAMSGPVDQIMGAFWLMRRRDLVAIGGWDARFFLYMEDVDLALRLRRQGKVCYYIHDATVLHHGGGSTRQIKDIRLYYLLRSRILLARKHFSPGGRSLAVAATLVAEPLVRAAAAIATWRLSELAAVARVAAWLWSTYPFIRPADTGEAGWAFSPPPACR